MSSVAIPSTSNDKLLRTIRV
ncbi:MAG: hypothetical protein JWO59_3254, partial [Chloroflexi bacterium]|nr:hypothetical protein [Chloroflexota bacterium]